MKHSDEETCEEEEWQGVGVAVGGGSGRWRGNSWYKVMVAEDMAVTERADVM